MRWSLLALALAACTFDKSGAAAEQFFKDDSAADFSATGSTLTQAEIDANGMITPAAWTTGAALAKGANSELFTDPTSVAWATLDAATPAAVALAAPIGDYGSGAPVGVGITQTDNFTMWIEGEVWLEAGTHTFSLTADDNGLLELAPPGGAFTRVVTATWIQGAQTGTFAAPADGWYPIHLAMSEGNGTAQYVLQHQPPGGAMAPFDADRLRYPIAGEEGIVADAFDDFYLMQPVGRSLLAAALLDQQFGTSVPPNTGITASTLYSFHWSAQARVDLGGDYAFLLDTDDGQRLTVDGQLLLDELTDISESNTSAPVHLDPGWHDVVIDYTQYAAGAHATLHVASGPDLAGGPFPIDRVRPVVPRVDRVAAGGSTTDQFWSANGNTSYTFAIAAPAGATVDGVDAEYTINDQHDADVQVSIVAPGGTSVIVHPSGGTDAAGPLTQRATLHDFDGAAAGGSWQITAIDKGGRSGGNTRDGALTVHYTGGHAPIATTASYDSIVRDLGAASQIDTASYAASAPTGTTVAVKLRTGATADALMAASWSDPITSGVPPIVAPAELVQYRVELTSDGDHVPSFDWIELDYRPQ